ncbi:MAG: hypothetical protein QF351_05315 [Phycisphaerales bacterium]|nr:hypothetical protein [Phycisphaerales bacterium]
MLPSHPSLNGGERPDGPQRVQIENQSAFLVRMDKPGRTKPLLVQAA